MEMPLTVRLIWPSRKALLLFGSSQDSVPGMKVGYSAFAYSSALIVSGLLMTTLLCSSTILPPKVHSSQWVQQLPSPVALPRAKPPGVPLAWSACISLRKPSVSLGNELKPAAFTWLSRYTRQLPAQPIGIATHFFLSMP